VVKVISVSLISLILRISASLGLKKPPKKSAHLSVECFAVSETESKWRNDQGMDTIEDESTQCSLASISSDSILPSISEASRDMSSSTLPSPMGAKHRASSRHALRTRDRRLSQFKMSRKSKVSPLRASTPVVLPSLDTGLSAKYFGEKSKEIFYTTYRDLHSMRNNLLGGDEELESVISRPIIDLDRNLDIISSRARSHWSFADDNDSSVGADDDSLGDDSTITTINSPNRSIAGQTIARVSSIHSSSARSQASHGDYSQTSAVSKKSFEPSSPRAKYLLGCLKYQKPPRAALMLREKSTTSLILNHQGIGDELGLIFSAGLQDLPNLTTLHLIDNNLSDDSLTAIIRTIARSPNITDVNLSNNVVGGKAADALAEYFRDPKCTLRKISLRSANVDDGECHKFVDALGYNRRLEVGTIFYFVIRNKFQ
jgi:hypothetical protein